MDASAAVPQASGHSLLPSAGGALVSYTVSDCGTQGALQTLQSDGSAPVPHAGSGAGGHSPLQADNSAAVIAAEALQAMQAPPRPARVAIRIRSESSSVSGHCPSGQ